MANQIALPQLPPRESDGHKGDYGRVLVIGGSTGMAGAPCLAGMAALRSGAGLCTIAVPQSVYPMVASQVICCTTHPVPANRGGGLGFNDLDALIDFANGFDAVALGPGMGRDDETWRAVRRLVETLTAPTVVDADGLNAISGQPDLLRQSPGPRVLTPHPGEMARLAGLKSAADVNALRAGLAETLARDSGAVVLLKGAETVITDGQRTALNATGNPGMATGGSGDVLTGVIAALIGQGIAPFDAARLGAHVHGLAGDIACEALGQVSMTAFDILEALPEAFLALT